jgi:ABC-2 type transport system permease protein
MSDIALRRPAVETPVVTPGRMWRSFLGAEWIKLRSVRSTVVTLAVAAISAVGFGALSCARYAQEYARTVDPSNHAALAAKLDAASQSLVGNALAQLAIGALGVLFVTSEFGTGMIRASLAAMPQRGGWIAAKLAVFGLVAVVVGQALTFASFGIGQAILARQHIGLSLGSPGALRSVVATGLYVALIGLLGATLGLIIRHTAGALTSLLGLLFVLPALLGALPVHMQGQVARFLPENIGEQAATTAQLHNRFPPWNGIGLMVGYAVALAVVGLLLLNRRDA